MSNYRKDRNRDSGRFNLVTKLHCAKCGHQLELSYSFPPVSECSPEKSDGITGSGKYEAKVGVHPCSVCYDAIEKPLRDLKKAFESIQESKA